jgi:hypothetical protein
LNTDESEPTLTVDGLISTAYGPHNIRLTLSDRFGSVFVGNIKTVNDALVVIRDSEGNTTQLKEFILDSVTFFNTSPQSPYTHPEYQITRGWVTIPVFRKTGIYKTPVDFKAEVGKSYTLVIRLANGQNYTSLPEKINPVAKIDNLEYNSFRRPASNPILDGSGIQILSSFKDVSESNYYLWKLTNPVYPYITTPEEGGFECCSICYRYDDSELENLFAIANDNLFDGQNITLPTIDIADDGWRFKDKLRVNFHQHSISKSGYNFLKLVQQQLSIEGSVFDPPPANIRGNMINLGDPTKQVLGYFFATDVSSNEIYIDSQDLDHKQTPGYWPDDCREVKGLSHRLSTDPPENWIF